MRSNGVWQAPQIQEEVITVGPTMPTCSTWSESHQGQLTSSSPCMAGIPAAPLMRRLGGFLLRWHLPGVALG